MEPPRIPESRLDQLRNQVGSRREIWVLAAIAAILVFGGLALWSRGAPAMIAPPAADEGVTGVPPASPSPVGVVVHVAGKVRRPGLYTLPEGSRVADAIEAAGGPSRTADLDLLNLAEVIVDGSKIEVLAAGDAPATVPPSSSTSGTAAQIGLNTADQLALEQIPGIGPVTAAAIIAYREQAGSFTAIEELLEVTGIGPATLESIRPYVTL